MSALPRAVAADAQAPEAATRPGFAAAAAAAWWTARPRQWSKNVLVLAAPLAAGAAGRGGREPGQLALAVSAFVCASCAVYFVNDLADLERDRRHPTKRLRPLASGRLTKRQAWCCAAFCLLAGEALGAATGRAAFSAVLSGYLALSLGYSLVLKHIPVLELAALASGFVLRALGGAVAAGIAPSGWFLLVCSLGALLMATAKRATEVALLGADATGHRPALRWYRASWLRTGQRVLVAAVVGAYLGWASGAPDPATRAWHLLSALPLLLALLRFDHLAARRPAARVEDLLVSDRLMVGAEALWLLAFLGPVL